MSPTRTIHSIQFLRAIAAFLVVMFHAQQAFVAHTDPAPYQTESYLFGFGAVGVHIFFVISGFIMVVTSQATTPYDPISFYRRRFMRIYPIYWVCAAGYVAIYWLIGQPYSLSIGETLRAMVLWPGDAPRIIAPAWTLAFEMYFYICFGVAMMASLTRGLALLGAAFLLAIAWGALAHPTSQLAGLATNTLLLEFLGGAAIGWLFLKSRLPLRAGPVLSFLGISLFAGGTVFGYERLPSAICWGLPSVIVVLGLVSWEQLRGANSLVRWLGKLGDSSYVLYLIHVAIIAAIETVVLATFGTHSLEPAFAAVVIALVCGLLAVAIHNRVEQPLLALMKSRTPPKAVSSPEAAGRTSS
jgi:exopolysaccharide production protein ExoZ